MGFVHLRETGKERRGLYGNVMVFDIFFVKVLDVFLGFFFYGFLSLSLSPLISPNLLLFLSVSEQPRREK